MIVPECRTPVPQPYYHDSLAVVRANALDLPHALLQSGHDLLVDAPEELVMILLDAA